jgi:hypothetical protein
VFTEKCELNCYALLTALVNVQFWSVATGIAMPGRSVATSHYTIFIFLSP